MKQRTKKLTVRASKRHRSIGLFDEVRVVRVSETKKQREAREDRRFALEAAIIGEKGMKRIYKKLHTLPGYAELA